MRAPSGQSGGDHQFAAGVKAGLSYDVTLSSTQYSTPFWPYTLDFKTSQDCLSCPCPTQSYKGFWEFPVTSLIDGNDIICSNLFSCAYNSTMKDAYSLLNGNYKYHQAQAAPFVIIVPLPWLFDSDNAKGLNKFLKEAVGDKTYVVTLNQALAWLQSPTKTSELAKFQPWQCAQPRPKQCSTLKCKIKFNSETINFNFCTSKNTTLCPPSYPWVNNLPWNSA